MTDIDANDDTPEEMRRLIELTQGRAPLEALRDVYSGRLHRQSDDFDATAGLRLVSAKLRRLSYAPPVVTASS
jgi:hypothetical protein